MTTQLSVIKTNLYDQDFYLWIETTVKLLQENKFDQVDLLNLIEELQCMGKSQKNALKSNLIVVLMHLLKYKYQPEKRSNSWLSSIFEHRGRLEFSLEDSPSLRRYLSESLDKCYQNARKQASLETGLNLNIFPIDCPFTLEQTLDSDYLPE